MKINYPILLGLGLSVLYVLFWPSEKDHLNAQMTELCKKNGGLKIYEIVKVPMEAYNNGGALKETNYKKLNEKESTFHLGNLYEVRTEITKIKEGDPLKGEGVLEQTYERVIRLSDKKLIAESIHYSRVGGDRWFAGMPSAESCPISDGMERDKIFIKNHN